MHIAGRTAAALAPGGRCLSSTRPPTSLEDHALVLHGWTLVGAYQRYGGTVVVTATSSVDGMCRPNALTQAHGRAHRRSAREFERADLQRKRHLRVMYRVQTALPRIAPLSATTRANPA